MRRLALGLVALTAGGLPSAALAAGWASAGRVEVLVPRVEPLTVVIRARQSRVENAETAPLRSASRRPAPEA